MKATAVAPSNIAFIKYWGRTNAKLRLPHNASISMNLSASTTTTTVEFLDTLSRDQVELLEPDGFSGAEILRVSRQLDVLRAYAKKNLFARVVTKNSFPKSSGAASSASGFAALTIAVAAALKLKISEKELTILARLGSGSACRSIPDGFVKWESGNTSEESYAHSLYPSSYWDLRDILVVVENKAKDVSSSEGHDLAETSIHFQKRLEQIPERITKIEEAFKMKNFQLLGETIEEDCLGMHQVMQTQKPPLYYWNSKTKELMDVARGWRKSGIPVYFTIDAGPNVHLICEAKDEAAVLEKVQSFPGVIQITSNKPSPGAYVINDHLF